LPWQAWIALGGLAVPFLIASLKFLRSTLLGSADRELKQHELGWKRAAELEEEIRLLRTALHRSQTRSAARATISEILLLAMPLPLEERIRAVKQARAIAEGTLAPAPVAE
jgi:hypothetical protein